MYTHTTYMYIKLQFVSRKPRFSRTISTVFPQLVDDQRNPGKVDSKSVGTEAGSKSRYVFTKEF